MYVTSALHYITLTWESPVPSQRNLTDFDFKGRQVKDLEEI